MLDGGVHRRRFFVNRCPASFLQFKDFRFLGWLLICSKICVTAVSGLELPKIGDMSVTRCIKHLSRITAVFVFDAIILTGCGSLPPAHHASPAAHHPNKPLTFSNREHAELYKRLDRQYRDWKGTPYRQGGMNRRGIDCSGFVYVAFRDGLGMHIPRTTESLANYGTHITKHQLNVGDLVFFKTGFGKHHVGIYIGNQQFVHASTSKGVMKSSLNNPYWADHYWKSIRLIAN